ncbi:MAG TPA: hypothetical protein VGF84_23345 [Micromonosporaceae bacterium]
MEVEAAARGVDDVGSALIEVATRLRALPVPAVMFGADGSGAFGELGRALAGRASGAIEARAFEATALGRAASALASTATGATAALREVDDRRGHATRSGGA